MKIICEECGSTYKIKDELIKGKVSIKTQCPKCKFIQKNELIQKKEGNPFQDSDQTVDFIASIKNKNKDLNSTEFDASNSEKYKPIKELPSIDLESLQKEEIKEKISKNKNKSNNIKEENNNIKNDISSIKESKGLYNAKKGSSFLGPFTLEEIKGEIKKRRITKEFLFSKDGEDWKSIENHKELIVFFQNTNGSSNALKYLIIGIILIGIAYVSVSLLDKYNNNNDIMFQPSTNKVTTKNKTNLLSIFIEKWKKNIILSEDSDSIIYSKAIQNFYADSSDLYIKSSNQFKEVLVKNNLKYDAFYYLVLSVSFSNITIENKTTLKEYLKILKSINEPKKQNELYYNALSALSLKLELFVDSYNYAEETKHIVSNNAIANYLLGKFYFNSKKIDKAVEHLKTSIKSDDRLIIAKKLLSKTFLDFELYKDAISFYKKNDSSFAKLILSKIYVSIGDYKRAFIILKKLNQENSSSKSNILYAKLLYQYKNNKKLALKVLQNIEEKSLFTLSEEDKILVLSHISIIYRLLNDLPKSIKYSKKIFEIDPNNRFAKFNLALIRIEQKKYKEVSILLKQFNASTKSLDKFNYFVNYELFFSQKKYSDSIGEIRQIINLEKYNNIYYVFLADLYSRENNLPLLQEALLNLNSINPDYYIDNHYKLTDFYIKTFNMDYLIKYLENSLRSKNSDKALLLNNLGLLNYQLRNFKKAIFYFTKSIELSNRNISNYIYLSYSNYRLRNYAETIKIAQSSYMYGKNKYLYLIHIKALLKLKKIDEAEELLKQVKYDFEYDNITKLMKSLILIEDGKEKQAMELLLEIREDYQNDLAYNQLLFSLTY
jgi:tetratricopeptide (TPR) repeat protein